MTRCIALGLAPVDVRGDGNCLIWSLRSFQLGWDCDISVGYDSPAALQQKALLRGMLKDAWWSRKHDPYWQDLFMQLCDESLPILTPSKKMPEVPNGEDEPEPALATPKKAKLKPKVADSARAVPLAQNRFPASPALKGRSKSPKTHAWLEAPIPDIEEDYHKQLMTVDTAVHEITSDMLPAPEQAQGQRRTAHSRKYKSKGRSAREESDKMLVQWLARKDLTYKSFESSHRKAAPIPKAVVCDNLGWKGLKVSLRNGTYPNCDVCRKILTLHGVDLQEAQDVLNGAERQLMVASQSRQMRRNLHQAMSKMF